jgi:uncharacterized membrane protein YqjE
MNWLGLFGLDEKIERYRLLAAEAAIAAESRVELLTIEWEEEKLRLRRLLVLAVLAAALSIVALTVLSIAVMIHFWDSGHRQAAAWWVAGFWVVAWGAVLFALKSAADGGSRAFAITRQELARDWSDLKERL